MGSISDIPRPTHQQTDKIINLMTKGSSISEVATELNIDRTDLTELMESPENLALLNQIKLEPIESAQTLLINLGRKAIEVLEDALNSNDENIRLKSATFIVRGLGLVNGAPELKVDAKEIEADQRHKIWSRPFF